MKPEEKQLVAETQRLFLVFRRQVDGHIIPKAGLAHRLGQTPALQRLVLKEPPSRHDLGTKDRIRPGIEFTGFRSFRAKYGKAFSVSIVQDLHDVCVLIGKPEVAFVDDQRSPEGINDAKEG